MERLPFAKGRNKVLISSCQLKYDILSFKTMHIL